jgi:hypothetical protein
MTLAVVSRHRRSRRGAPAAGVLAAVVVLAWGCQHDSSKLSPELEQRLAAEAIVMRADNVTFRWTHNTGRTDGAWRDRRESIIVTKQTVLIHDNEYLDLEITPRSRRAYEVHRDGGRVRINAGSGRSAVVWSFEPDSAEAWTAAIRQVIRQTTADNNR